MNKLGRWAVLRYGLEMADALWTPLQSMPELDCVKRASAISKPYRSSEHGPSPQLATYIHISPTYVRFYSFPNLRAGVVGSLYR